MRDLESCHVTGRTNERGRKMKEDGETDGLEGGLVHGDYS